MAITSDEVNFLIFRYLQESGFMHSAFTFAYESQLAKTSVVDSDLPPGALISFIQKGLQYVGIEAHVNEDGTERECTGEFSLLSPHICRVAQSATSSARSASASAKASNKRKRKHGDASSPDAVDAAKVTEANGVGKSDSSTTATAGALIVLTGHEKEVYGCLWNPVQNILVSGSSDSTARIWDIPTDFTAATARSLPSKVLSHGTGPHKDVTTLEWNPDGTLLASGTYNGKTRIWDVQGELKHTFQYHNGPVFATRWSKSGTFLLSASFDKTVAVWDLSTETKKQQLKLHDDPILDASWRDDSTFATCSSDMRICVARVGELKPDVVLTGHADAINSVKWDPSGRLLASCSDDFTVKVWDPLRRPSDETTATTTATTASDPSDQQQQQQPEGDASDKASVSPSRPIDSTSDALVTTATPSASAMALVHTLAEHTKEVYTFRWSCSGPGSAHPSEPVTLASASFDGTVKIWDVESGTCIRTFEHQYPVYGVAYSPDGAYLASGTIGGTINVWNLKDGRLLKTYQANGDIYEVNWNTQSSLISACVSNGDVALINFRL